MEYDMAEKGMYSRNRRKKEIVMKREEQDTQELQKEDRSDYQQNMSRTISVTSSTARLGVTRN
jgi:hypothetical protein